MTEPTEILPGIFVGNQWTASDAQFFGEKSIRRVVNCTNTVPFYFTDKATYFRIPVDDSNNEIDNNKMAAYLLPAIRFILEIQPNSNRGVLIHCQAGVSRSCTVAAAVLRFCCIPTIPLAIEEVIRKRSVAFFRGMYFNFSPALHSVFSF